MMNGHKRPIGKSLKIRQNISLKFLKILLLQLKYFGHLWRPPQILILKLNVKMAPEMSGFFN